MCASERCHAFIIFLRSLISRGPYNSFTFSFALPFSSPAFSCAVPLTCEAVPFASPLSSWALPCASPRSFAASPLSGMACLTFSVALPGVRVDVSLGFFHG